jgi:hypothetical protein
MRIDDSKKPFVIGGAVLAVVVAMGVVMKTASASGTGDVVDIGPVSKPITRMEDIPADTPPQQRAAMEAAIKMGEGFRQQHANGK